MEEDVQMVMSVPLGEGAHRVPDQTASSTRRGPGVVMPFCNALKRFSPIP
jgi:hypothetical protein